MILVHDPFALVVGYTRGNIPMNESSTNLATSTASERGFYDNVC